MDDVDVRSPQILTHSYSRTVIQALLKAHQQNKRIKVYVAEARPQGLG
jgi:translation initiation factor eIF-2B subunit alpha